MDILEKIKEDVKQFRKNRDLKSVQLLQTLIGELDTRSKNGEVINDAKVVKLVETFVKNNDTTISLAPNAPRVEALKFENELLNKYLPSLLTEAEIDRIIEENNFDSIKTGMDYFRINHAGRYDGGLVSRKLKK